MISVDRAVTALREANPVPSVEAFHEFTLDAAHFLDATRERSERMETLERQQTSKQWKWRIPALAAAAFVVVLGVGIVLALALARSEPEPAAPLEIATGYIEARNTGDTDAIEALVADSARIEGDLAATTSDLANVSAFNRAIGETITIDTCTEAPIEGTTSVEVSCTYNVQNDWTRALGIEVIQVMPFDTGNEFIFEVTDGKITRLESSISSDYFTRVLNPFVAWLEATHPDAIAEMWLAGPSAPWPANRPLMTPEAIALWEHYSQEYVEYVQATG